MSYPMLVTLNQIRPNPKQPRQTFDPSRLLDLAQSIKQHGLIQPPVVEPAAGSEDLYYLHDGERRWRAACALAIAEVKGIESLQDFGELIHIIATGNPLHMLNTHEPSLSRASIPVVFTEVGYDDQDKLVRAIVANDQRDDLSPIERAQGYQQLHDTGLSDNDIAAKVGRSRSVVANARRLLELPEHRRQDLGTGALSERQALALLTYYQLPDHLREEVKDSYYGRRVLLNPNILTADQIRGQIRDAVRSETQELTGKDFPLDHEFDHVGQDGPRGKILQADCIDCPQIVQIGKEKRCSNEACYSAKKIAYRAIWLQQASEATGLPAIDIGPLSYGDDYTHWYKGGNEAIIKQAKATNCPNLKVSWSDWGSNYLKPNDLKTNQPYDRQHCIYVCHHSGEKCACQRELHREEDEAKARAEQELQTALEARRQRLDQALASWPIDQLKLGCYYSTYYYDPQKRDAVLKLKKPDAIRARLVDQILETIRLNHGEDPDTYLARLDQFLTGLGFNPPSPQGERGPGGEVE